MATECVVIARHAMTFQVDDTWQMSVCEFDLYSSHPMLVA